MATFIMYHVNHATEAHYIKQDLTDFCSRSRGKSSGLSRPKGIFHLKLTWKMQSLLYYIVLYVCRNVFSSLQIVHPKQFSRMNVKQIIIF